MPNQEKGGWRHVRVGADLCNLSNPSLELETSPLYLVAIIRFAGPGMRTRLDSANPASFNQASYSGSL
jgi:hypothetical protein